MLATQAHLVHARGAALKQVGAQLLEAGAGEGARQAGVALHALQLDSGRGGGRELAPGRLGRFAQAVQRARVAAQLAAVRGFVHVRQVRRDPSIKVGTSQPAVASNGVHL